MRPSRRVPYDKRMNEPLESGEPNQRPTRDRLVEAARTCVRDRGLGGATSREITASPEQTGAVATTSGRRTPSSRPRCSTSSNAGWRPPFSRWNAPARQLGAQYYLAIQELAAEFERSR